VLNDPVKYTDPNGYRECEGIDPCVPLPPPPKKPWWAYFVADGDEEWLQEDIDAAILGMQAIGAAIARELRIENRIAVRLGESPARSYTARGAFLQVFGAMTFRRVDFACADTRESTSEKTTH
jgi:hypothetical protein